MDNPATDNPVVLFDGVCNLCNGAVRFIIHRDPKARFRFASLQSEAGRQLMEKAGYQGDPLGSILLIQRGQVHARSGAALRIALGLKGAWPFFGAFLLVPRFLRDWVYDFIAARRYAWFGKREYCEIPLPSERKRFLSYS